MKLLSIRNRSEGEDVAVAVLSLWRMMFCYDGVILLRSIGVCLMLPFPYFATYENSMTRSILRSWRVPVIGARIGFVLGKKSRPNIGVTCFLKAIGNQKMIATREQIEDSFVIQ
jgi:hypothetical protein